MTRESISALRDRTLNLVAAALAAHDIATGTHTLRGGHLPADLTGLGAAVDHVRAAADHVEQLAAQLKETTRCPAAAAAPADPDAEP